ncbi:MAG: ATP synthase F1 subunit gamma [Planctomycetes bacterium]|nr:ATP synthase F1 subunit gamma [Planctomycetota bacterium]
MAKIKEIRNRIKSVRATHKITSTMEMVATGRMKRALNRMLEARPFLRGFTEVMARLVSSGDLPDHPLLAERADIRREAVVVLSSNRGLCGAFNTNLYRRCMEELRRIRSAGHPTEIHVLGKKVAGLLRFQGEEVATAAPLPDRPVFADAVALARALTARFAAAEEDRVDRVTLVCARYESALRQPAVTLAVLPVRPAAPAGLARGAGDAAIYSPARAEIFASLLPVYVESVLFQALLETTASEQVARRNAMKNATENAEDMIKTLTRNLNKVRQAQITRELAEIVGGSQGLR